MTREVGSRTLIGILIAISAIGPASTQMFLPALPAIQTGFGISPGTAQLSLSLAILSMAVFTLAYGPWSDHSGRRPVIIWSIIFFLVGSVVSALAPNIWVLIVGRIAQAAGGAGGLVLARAVVRDVYGAEKAASVISLVTMAMVAAPLMAPAIGGVITDYYGWRWTFVFITVCGLLTLYLVLKFLDESHHHADKPSGLVDMLGSFVNLMRSPLFCVYAFQGAFSMGIFFAFISSAPYVMVNVIGIPATEYGLWFMIIAVGYMVGNLISARISERVGVNRMVVAGALMSLLSAVAMGLFVFNGIWAPWAIFSTGAFSALSNGISLPNAQAGAINVNPAAAGAASGLTGFMQMALGAVVAQGVGFLQGGTPYAMVGTMLAMSTLAVLPVVLLPYLGRSSREGGKPS
jgi:MFS transporter, DHA1 family, multidrug resistance protein